jgi:hypothetical protein
MALTFRELGFSSAISAFSAVNPPLVEAEGGAVISYIILVAIRLQLNQQNVAI